MAEKPLFVKVDSPTGFDPVTFKIIGSKWFAEQDSFQEYILCKAKDGTTFAELEQEIAEWHYRRPIPIPLTGWAVRPFWRDGKGAPPLPFVDKNGRIYKPLQLSNGQYVFQIPVTSR